MVLHVEVYVGSVRHVGSVGHGDPRMTVYFVNGYNLYYMILRPFFFLSICRGKAVQADCICIVYPGVCVIEGGGGSWCSMEQQTKNTTCVCGRYTPAVTFYLSCSALRRATLAARRGIE